MLMPHKPKGKRALVVEGGAMRGIFAAGVLDAFIQADFYPFDFVIGVSAGSTAALSYLSGDFQRTYKVFQSHATRPEFINFRRALTGGHLTDVRWLIEESAKDEVLDEAMFLRRGIPLYVVSTRIRDGKPCYSQIDLDNLGHVLPATCAIPLAYRDYPKVKGMAMTDGGLSDSIPVETAYAWGARDITVILSQSHGYRKRPANKTFMNLVLRKQPALARATKDRYQHYNRSLDFIDEPPADCNMRMLAPGPEFKVGRLSRNGLRLRKGYLHGKHVGEKFIAQVKKGGAE
ncbi:patatin-like phospholipase family protein [Aliidiomarina soli]|nr:patatin family protein [Aliidiomarina soli]